MHTSARSGRLFGILMLAQLLTAPVVNFVLMGPVLAKPDGFLVNAATHAPELRLAVVLGLATGALSIALAIVAWPVFRQHSERHALWYLALAVACFALTAVENIAVMSMLSLSQSYATVSPTDPVLFQGLRGVVASARNWAHYTQLIAAGGMIFMLYATLFRFALVPRALAAFGMAAALLQITTILRPCFGHEVLFPLLMPLGLCHLALATWLLWRGFVEPQPQAAQ